MGPDPAGSAVAGMVLLHRFLDLFVTLQQQREDAQAASAIADLEDRDARLAALAKEP